MNIKDALGFGDNKPEDSHKGHHHTKIDAKHTSVDPVDAESKAEVRKWVEALENKEMSGFMLLGVVDDESDKGFAIKGRALVEDMSQVVILKSVMHMLQLTPDELVGVVKVIKEEESE